MCEFNALNQIFLSLFDVSKAFFNWHWSEHVSNNV